MNQKRIHQIALECARCVEAFGKEWDAVDMTVTDSKKAVIFNLEFRLCRIEFVLTVKNSMMCPVGTLFARIFPQKNHPLSLHVYELLEPDDFRCPYFPYNHSPEQVQLSFAVLAGLVWEVLPRAEQLALDTQQFNQVLREKCALLAAFAKVDTAKLQEKLSEEEVQDYLLGEWGEFYETFGQLLPFTQSDPYAAFIMGDVDKALKGYAKMAKKKDMPAYFLRLLDFLQTPQARTFAPLPEECGAVYLQGRQQQYGAKEGGYLLLLCGILYALFLPVSYLIAGGLYAAFCGGAAYAPFGWGMPLLLPALPALFGTLSLRRRLYARVFPKDADRWLAQDELENSATTNRVCYVLFGLTAAVCLYFNVVFTLCVPRFYADRMIYDDAARFPLLNPVIYAYEDLEQVYYIEGRVNVFGDLVERGSYVLVFTDGSVIDLDGSISVEQTEKRVLPLLTSYVEKVTTYATDVELAKQYGKSADDFFGYNDTTW